MAMSNAIRRELGKNRELLWHLLDGLKCCFCHKPLLDVELLKMVKFGDATAPALAILLTIHHKNGNHKDNRRRNRDMSHQSCHKSWEAKRVFTKWRKANPAQKAVAGICGRRAA